MDKLEKVLEKVFVENKDFTDTVYAVEQHLKGEFDWQIGNSEDQGMYMANYAEIENAEETEISWVYSLPVEQMEVFDNGDEKMHSVDVIAYYEVVEKSLDLSETKVRLTGVELY